MNYSQIFYNDMVNGEGVRTTLFVNGCIHACKGCYNQSTWNPDNGNHFTREHSDSIIESLRPKYVSGLSLTGGDPLHPNNLRDILRLIAKVRMVFGDTKDIWLWTGFTLEEIKYGAAYGNADMAKRLQIINEIDVLVDGKFEQDNHEHGLPFRGSTNQIIHRFTEF
ncbi:MAG: anaerobic ribonucleoside-triphosphate reductase activating protein [Fusobacteriaceae bacterium]